MTDSQIRPRPARSVAWASSDVIAWMRARVAASGGNPEIIPDQQFAFWRIDEVERRVGVKKSTLYRWVGEGIFPRSIPLGVTDSRDSRAA